jgi:hypothetical protein
MLERLPTSTDSKTINSEQRRENDPPTTYILTPQSPQRPKPTVSKHHKGAVHHLLTVLEFQPKMRLSGERFLLLFLCKFGWLSDVDFPERQ